MKRAKPNSRPEPLSPEQEFAALAHRIVHRRHPRVQYGSAASQPPFRFIVPCLMYSANAYSACESTH